MSAVREFLLAYRPSVPGGPFGTLLMPTHHLSLFLLEPYTNTTIASHASGPLSTYMHGDVSSNHRNLPPFSKPANASPHQNKQGKIRH